MGVDTRPAGRGGGQSSGVPTPSQNQGHRSGGGGASEGGLGVAFGGKLEFTFAAPPKGSGLGGASQQ